jgi:hypothetical protein
MTQVVPLEDLAHYRGLAGDARAVLEAFSVEREAGSLKPAQFASLLALEAALSTLPPVPVTFVAPARPPVPLSRMPAADLTPGDVRSGFAAGPAA